MVAIIKNRYRVFGVILMLCFSCVEPYDIETTETFEDFLVVEALLTDKLMFQEIKLSRTFELEDGVPIFERNAQVSIIDDLNMEYRFNEVEQGKYISEVEFNALPDREYTLLITTSSGKNYSSTKEKLVEGNVVDFNLYTQSGVGVNGEEGVSIYYESSELGNENSRYFRFEYVETYKIVPPYWSDEYFIVNQNGSLSRDIKDNDDGKVCFGYDDSKEIILRNASEYALNNVEPFVIKFNERDNQKIQNRYSLLVKQYLISREAYTFYETLKDFSESGSVLSETQPGTVLGNMYSENNETVIGFFEVAKTLEKRVFFNYTDYFYNSQLFLRPYFYKCDVLEPFLVVNPNVSQTLSLREMVEQNLVIYYAENFWDQNPIVLDPDKPYQVVMPACGDCSIFADIEVPDFWEE